jgi:serine/threonine-protein kinase RsbW
MGTNLAVDAVMKNVPEVAADAAAEIVDRPPRPGKPARADALPVTDERSFDARMDAIADGAAFVEAFCERNDVDAADTLRLTLVIEELFANIVTHGYGEEAGGTIRLGLALDGRDVMIVCEDRAPAYDPRAALKKLPDDLGEPVETRRVGGLGQLLVGRLVDVTSYVRVQGANVLALRFRTGARKR